MFSLEILVTTKLINVGFVPRTGSGCPEADSNLLVTGCNGGFPIWCQTSEHLKLSLAPVSTSNETELSLSSAETWRWGKFWILFTVESVSILDTNFLFCRHTFSMWPVFWQNLQTAFLNLQSFPQWGPSQRSHVPTGKSCLILCLGLNL